jgi:predicted bacteriocin transport accessory protein
MKNKDKNSNAGTKWIILVFALVLISSIVITEIINDYNKKVQEISVSQLANELTIQNEKLVLLTKNDCPKCDELKKIMEKFKADGTTVYTINVDKLSNSDLNALTAKSSLIKTNELPSVLHLSGGEIIGSYTGKANYNDIVDFMTVFKKITVAQYLDLAKEDVDHYIYIGRPTCSHCVSIMPVLKRIVYDTGKDIYYINTDAETSNSLQTLASTTQVYDGSTPLFMVVKNNAVLRNHAGGDTYDNLKAFFEGTNQQ